MSLKEEKEFLNEIKQKLNDALKMMDERVISQARELHETKKYLYENKTGMDRMEKESVRQSVTQGALVGEGIVKKRKQIYKLLDSPYFGRFDFSEKGQTKNTSVYIGIHSFFDESANGNLIHDWRAPVSSMFYDFELGDAYYEAPGGRVSGKISLKRQFRIRKGRMEYMLENAGHVYDEILQQELSRSSDDKMKNIVATIQRDQNPIVRNETSRVLIIQGVAGSGKTSIALHRIAFLLYRFKDTITAENILIISPNKVFADYIANVLPELGEEKIPEMGMEELAAKVLENKYRFQTFHEQVSVLMEKNDPAFKERIRLKSSVGIITKLEEYLLHINNEYFNPVDIVVGRNPIPAWFIKEKFDSLHRLPVFKRFAMIAQATEDNIRHYYKKELSTEEKKELLTEITRMFRITNLRQLYKDFYEWMGKPEMLKLTARSKYEYADVFPLLFLKLKLEGHQPFHNVKHLLIDEMQDYSPVQYAVISRLFFCNKTILGDANQKVNLFGSSTAEMIQRVFQEADVVKLRRSYRSTYEITGFAQGILPDSDLIAIERHGEKPEIKKFQNRNDEVMSMLKQITSFNMSGYHSLGLICKTEKQAEWLYEQLSCHSDAINRFTEKSAIFTGGVIITTIHLSKGLEFDHVIVPFVTHENYQTELDRHLLYIACTRAMHRLEVSYTNSPSKYI